MSKTHCLGGNWINTQTNYCPLQLLEARISSRPTRTGPLNPRVHFFNLNAQTRYITCTALIFYFRITSEKFEADEIVGDIEKRQNQGYFRALKFSVVFSIQDPVLQLISVLVSTKTICKQNLGAFHYCICNNFDIKMPFLEFNQLGKIFGTYKTFQLSYNYYFSATNLSSINGLQ